jgi:hypothetical protein
VYSRYTPWSMCTVCTWRLSSCAGSRNAHVWCRLVRPSLAEGVDQRHGAPALSVSVSRSLPHSFLPLYCVAGSCSGRSMFHVYAGSCSGLSVQGPVWSPVQSNASSTDTLVAYPAPGAVARVGHAGRPAYHLGVGACGAPHPGWRSGFRRRLQRLQLQLPLRRCRLQLP